MSALKDPFSGKPIIALDFDAVIHEYHGWNGGKMNGAIPFAAHAIDSLRERGFRVIIFSTRDEEMIKPWLKDHGFPELEICSEKPPAVCFVDDRAITFDGEWTPELIDRVCNFRAHWE